MWKLIAFIIVVVSVCYLLYVTYQLFTQKKQSSSLEDDLEKGEKAREKIEQLNQKIKK